MKALFIFFVCLSVNIFSQLPWTPPQTISAQNVTALLSEASVDVTCDAQGNAIAIWGTVPIPTEQIFIARLINKVWSSPLMVSDLANGGIFPSISLNSTGQGFGAWCEVGGGASVVARPISLTSLGPIQIVDGGAGFIGRFPNVGVNGAGAGIVSWKDATGVGEKTEAQILSTMTTETFVPDGNDDPGVARGFTKIAVNEAGRAAVIWNSVTPEFVVNYFNGSVWSGPFTIAVEAADGEVAIDSSGTAYIVGIVGGSVEIATFNGTTVTSITIAGGTNELPAIATNRNGQAFAVWRDITNPAAAFIEATMFNGSSWSTPVPISDVGGAPLISPLLQDFPQVGVDGNGNAIATWGRFINATFTSIIESAKYEVATGSWSSVVPIESISSSSFEFTNKGLDVNSSGSAVAVWNQTENVGGFPAFIRASFFFVPPSPRNLKGCCIPNHFLGQTEQVKILNWDPSLAENVVCYQILRNGRVIGKVPANCCCFEDHNRNCCCCDTYQVRAITSDGTVGEFATIKV